MTDTPDVYVAWTLTIDMTDIDDTFDAYVPDAGNRLRRTVNAITTAGIRPISVTIEDGQTIRLIFSSYGLYHQALSALDNVLPLLWLME